MQYTDSYLSPLGAMTLASNGDALTGLWFDGQKHFTSTLSAPSREKRIPLFAEAKTWLDAYFGGALPSSLPQIALQGSPFRLAVWAVLREIPYGETTTYKEVARLAALRLGATAMSAQAVGGAVGCNPISILIPCHRVVGSNGNLTGYAGGIERKRALLALERAASMTQFDPDIRAPYPEIFSSIHTNN